MARRSLGAYRRWRRVRGADDARDDAEDEARLEEARERLRLRLRRTNSSP